MRRSAALSIAAFAVLALAACSGGGGTQAPAATPDATTPPAQSEAPAGSPAAGAACEVSTETAGVTIDIADFTFVPADATASVGTTVGWTNSDTAPHTATMDDGSCDTGNLASGAAGALTFNAAGTYTYHCAIHPNMKGSIAITE